MQYTILDNLKLSESDALPNYTKCGASLSFPGYNYFVTEEGRQLIDDAAGITSVQFEDDPEGWICSKADASGIKDFEAVLFRGFSDMRSMLSRMLIVEDEGQERTETEPDWIDFEETREELAEIEAIKGIDNLSKQSLPTLEEQEILSFADYDAMVELLKAKQQDTKARRLLYMSMLETLYVTEGREMLKFSKVLDVFFVNLLIAIQQSKYVCPEEACQFMSFMMKSFILKDKRGL